MNKNYTASSILIFTILLIISSCGDDDEEGIVGEWRSESFSITGCSDGSSDIVNFPCGGCFTNEYNSEGGFSGRILIPGSLDSTYVGIYTIDGDMLTTCDENGANCETVMFTISDGELTISGEGLGCDNLEISLERS